MRNSIIIVLISFLTLTDCSLNNDNNNSTPQVIKVYWNLVNVSGGFAGVDDDFELDTIVWTFDDEAGTLNIVNGNTDDTKQDGLDSGDYNFSILNVDEDSFLVVNSTEIGSLTLTTNQLILNENETSEGTIADGFIYTFTKTTIIE